jgi:galactarate dehydratase
MESHLSIEEIGWEIFHMMLEVASGHKKKFTEQWNVHNAISLFKSAPAT